MEPSSSSRKPWNDSRFGVGLGWASVATELVGAFLIAYDFLVLATGVTHSYFGRNEFEKFAPGLKSLADAVSVRLGAGGEQTRLDVTHLDGALGKAIAGHFEETSGQIGPVPLLFSTRFESITAR